MDDHSYEENVELVKKFFDEDDWHYETQSLDSLTVFQGNVGGFKGLYSSYGFRLCVIGDEIVRVSAVFPAGGSEKLAEIAEFIVRVNHGLKYGAFDFDPSDGEITFEMRYPSDLIHVDREWIIVLDTNNRCMIQYAP